MLSSSAAACSSKLNWRQKRLRSARPQARLTREPNGEWITRCMSPVSSKKRSKISVRRVGQHAERGLGGGEVLDELLAGGRRQARASARASARTPARRPRAAGPTSLSQPRHRRGQLVAAARRLAEPERNGGRLAVRVLDEHLAGLHLADAVGGVAELEDVAGQALEGEVLVQRADAQALRQQHHVVVELVGDRAAVGDGRQPRAAPGRAAAGSPRRGAGGRRAGRGGW